MTLRAFISGLLAVPLGLAACHPPREGGELRLKHEVTIMTPGGEQSFNSVVALNALQTYGYSPGTSGWSNIHARLTGSPVRVPVGEKNFYILLSAPEAAGRPAYTQMEFVKTHFEFPNAISGDEWIELWQSLARTDRQVLLNAEDYPLIAVMPRNGWMDDAKKISLAEAEGMGFRIARYSLQVTHEPVRASIPFKARYRSEKSPNAVGRKNFVATDERH